MLNYISSRGIITFFDDSKPPPPIPVGASVWKAIRSRPDVPQLKGEYLTEYDTKDDDEQD